MILHLQRDVLPECDVSRHGQVVELQHVGDFIEPGQEVVNLQTKRQQTLTFMLVSVNLSAV